MKKGTHPWVQGDIHATVSPHGQIMAVTKNLRPGKGGRPNSFEEAGANPVDFEALANRYMGVYYTPGYLGGATALLAPWKSFELVEDPAQRDRVLERFLLKYGPIEPDVLLCCVRNDLAPVIHNCAEPAGGMAQDFDLLLEQTKEIVEIGLYKPEEGWFRFDAPALDEVGRRELISEQQECWEVVHPDFPMAPDAVLLEHLEIGQDSLDGRLGVISAGSVGDFAITSFARLNLSEGDRFRIRDLECHYDRVREHFVPLNRKVVMIANRIGCKCPIMFQFGPDGLLDRCAPHFALQGENLELVISHLCRGVLGPQGLNWLAYAA